MYGAPRPSEGRETQESWWSGDGPTHPCVPQYPEAQASLDVKPPEGERGGAAMKASARSDGSKLWRVETQEGIDGWDPRDPGDRTDSSQEQGPVAGRVVEVSPLGVVRKQRVTAGGQGPREGYRLRRREDLEG